MSKIILSESVINWYEKNYRKLPWRPILGENPNIYFVLVSEFMLQQTVVKTVIPYFNKFVLKYKNIFILANADLNDVLSEWSGLGYYRRAKNLHDTCKIICKKYNGIVPNDFELLMSLPGIGEYTASAIMSIGYNYPSNVVDGNIERIFSRLNKISIPIKNAKKKIRSITLKHVPKSKISFYFQGLMDIGATICKPKISLCSECPITAFCKVSNSLEAINYPIREKKIKNNFRKGTFLCFVKNNDSILLTKNNNRGLFANMDVIPSFGWEINKNENKYPIASGKVLPLKLNHSFTHFNLEVSIILYREFNDDLFYGAKNSEFVKFVDLENKAIPSLIKKIINEAKKFLSN